MERVFIQRSLLPSINRFKRNVRACLMEIGKSPDTHIYDLHPHSFDFCPPGEALGFIVSLMRFYAKLESDMDRQILITEVLERGRHYPFWHYGLIETPDYRQRVYALYEKLDQAFHIKEEAL